VSQPLRIAVTGASGFLGRLLVQLLRRRHTVVALDRRPLIEAEMAGHPNVEWYQVDLADREGLEGTIACIRAGGGADVMIHLAAYYDFTGDEHPEYQRTNVDAMRFLLEAPVLGPGPADHRGHAAARRPHLRADQARGRGDARRVL
jgi:nucleoside-diphosphate-sugar epimerase